MRQVSSGSSARTVPAPTSTASISLRQRCTRARDRSLLIQRASPLALAILPSSVAANLSVTNGSRLVMNLAERFD